MPLIPIVMMVAACGGDPEPAAGPTTSFEEPTCDSPDEVCLQAPANGFQIQSDRVEIAAGEDIEFCEIVAAPGDPSETYYVKALESQMTQGSHHLIVSAIDVGSEDEGEHAVGDRFECFAMAGFGATTSLHGSQAPYSGYEFPDGVGKVVHGGQLIVVNYHYFNTSAAPISAEMAINFYTAEASRVKQVAQQFTMANVSFEVSPMTKATFSEECTLNQDVTMMALTRHTHQWGKDFSAWFVGGERDGEKAFTSTHYEDVSFPFAAPIEVKAGTGFRWECNFDNTEDYPLTFGENATDEMCILFGSFYIEGVLAPDSREFCVR